LPADLPKNEHLLWQGSPDERRLARAVFHLPLLAAYFGVLVGLRAVYALEAGTSIVPLLLNLCELSALALLTLGLFWYMARLMARTTVYTITDRRVVMQIGVVLDLTLNLPLARVDGVAVHVGRDGKGDIALAIEKNSKIAFLHLWPHARPWRLAQPQPMLRAVNDVAEVARVLTDAIEKAEGTRADSEPRVGARVEARPDNAMAAS
jgi:hypothetical protein